METWQNAGTVDITVNGETKRVPSVDGRAQAEYVIEHVHLWDGLDDPYLYTATAELDSGDRISTRFGCRVFHCDPEKGFFLNGRSYPLRGVSRHQDLQEKGNALSKEDHAADIAIIREIGANTLRLAHYQHAEENGIEAVVLESHKNWIEKDPVKSLELSSKWLKERC